jgi:hypothetical protein
MKKVVLIITCVCLTFLSVSQERTLPERVATFYPQYLIMKGIKAGMEFPLKDQSWMVVSPELYYSENDNWSTSSYNELYGTGLSLHNKRILSHDNEMLPYLSFQVNYNYFFLLVNSFEDAEELQYNFHKTGTGFTLGIQPKISDLAYLDIYLGIGFRKSFSTVNDNLSDYRDIPWDYAYTGPTLLAGVKFSFITKSKQP